MRSIYRQLFNNISKSINTSECDHLRILSIKLTSSVFFISEMRWCLAINNGPSFSFFTALMNGLFLREWWIDSSTFNLIKIHRFYYFFILSIRSVWNEFIRTVRIVLFAVRFQSKSIEILSFFFLFNNWNIY